jgi:hypothetical protein
MAAGEVGKQLGVRAVVRVGDGDGPAEQVNGPGGH